MIRRRTRPGYTLLEVLLASAIALLLLAGLYVAMDATLVRMDVTRTVVASNDLTRGVADRLTRDLADVLGPLPPKSGGESASASDDGSAAADDTAPAASSGSSSGAASGGPVAAAPASGESSADSGTVAPVSSLLPLGMGVIGAQDQLTLFCSRVPAAFTDSEAASAGVQLPADLVRVSYYMASDGRGLCRQERPWVTADGVGNATEPDRSTEASDLLAPEITAIGFEYFDGGGGWAGTWDGAVTDLDGEALTGPPRAIRITMTLQMPGYNNQPIVKQVTHTVALRAAVGNYQAPVEPDPAATDPTGSQ